MPLQATSGAASYDAFGGGVPVEPVYIEQIFSTYLYTGNGSTQTITNGIDLSGKGGLVWTKARVDRYHNLEDTVRGAGNSLWSNASSANYYYSDAITSFGSTGYTLGADGTGNQVNSSANYVSWTFRKQPKFFDVVTYTGTGSAQDIAHSLGSTPGCIIVKNTEELTSWAVYHRSLGGTYITRLNTSGASETGYENWANTDPTSTVFTVGNGGATNRSAKTYVAYLFAHDAGGFGLTGTDNVISCGSYTETSAPTLSVNLGYEPQVLLIKPSNGTGNWNFIDNMRGFSQTQNTMLFPNTSGAEGTYSAYWKPTATGFNADNVFGEGTVYIYIAIRRGPMKVPTLGTSVFSPVAANNAQGTENTTGFPLDMQILNIRGGYGNNGVTTTRLIGVSSNTTSSGTYLRTPSTAAELSNNPSTQYWSNTGFQTASEWASSGMIYWSLRRAPGFFDVVCYTGTGSARTVTHNLGVVPELMIVKRRSGAANWPVYSAASGNTKYQYLNSTLQADTFNMWNNTTPTASVFSISGDTDVNGSGSTYVAYLFATCAGVSKVGSYTGNGSTQTIDCGFTGGARFVMIKATSTTGDWMVADSARGIVSGSDPYLELNNTNAEVTGEDWLDTDSTGFVVNEVSGSNANTNGVTYIFLAIA